MSGIKKPFSFSSFSASRVFTREQLYIHITLNVFYFPYCAFKSFVKYAYIIDYTHRTTKSNYTRKSSDNTIILVTIDVRNHGARRFHEAKLTI
jgi:hypothetical protein